MLIRTQPTFEETLAVLGEGAQFDISCGVCGEGRKPASDLSRWIYPAVTPDGKTQKLLKVLMTNSCNNDCTYCAFRAGRDTKRMSFSPDRLAKAFAEMTRTRLATGLFLSSGIKGSAVSVMDAMLKTAAILRQRYQFKGYIHLKLLEGIEEAQVALAMQLAQRVSVNLEAVDDAHLRLIAPKKHHQGGLYDLLKTAAKLLETNPKGYLCKGLTTQFVVGPSGESDKALVQKMGESYAEAYGLKRVYFSAHNPIADTPLADSAPTPLWREHRLYQADFLMRLYGFKAEEFQFQNDGHFEQFRDPKKAWVDANLACFPIEINKAPIEMLLRVPGIGVLGAKRIIEQRRTGKISTPDTLKRMGVRYKIALPYLLFDGKSRMEQPLQLSLPF